MIDNMQHSSFLLAYTLACVLAAVGIGASVLLAVSAGPLSVGIGFITGLAPFATWQILLPRMASESVSLVKKLLLLLLILIKIGVVLGILYLAFTTGAVSMVPFLAGTLLTQAGFIVGVLIGGFRRAKIPD